MPTGAVNTYVLNLSVHLSLFVLCSDEENVPRRGPDVWLENERGGSGRGGNWGREEGRRL